MIALHECIYQALWHDRALDYIIVYLAVVIVNRWYRESTMRVVDDFGMKAGEIDGDIIAFLAKGTVETLTWPYLCELFAAHILSLNTHTHSYHHYCIFVCGGRWHSITHSCTNQHAQTHTNYSRNNVVFRNSFWRSISDNKCAWIACVLSMLRKSVWQMWKSWRGRWGRVVICLLNRNK